MPRLRLGVFHSIAFIGPEGMHGIIGTQVTNGRSRMLPQLLVFYYQNIFFIMKNSNKGFTLIELLVVIAIIGILSAVVLTATGGFRTRGKDANAKSTMASIKNAAELYYGSTGLNTYGSGAAQTVTYNASTVPGTTPPPTAVSVCTDTEMARLGKAVFGQTNVNVVCTSNPGSYTITTTLNDATIYCSDSNSFTGTIPSTGAAPFSLGVKCQ